MKLRRTIKPLLLALVLREKFPGILGTNSPQIPHWVVAGVLRSPWHVFSAVASVQSITQEFSDVTQQKTFAGQVSVNPRTSQT